MILLFSLSYNYVFHPIQVNFKETSLYLRCIGLDYCEYFFVDFYIHQHCWFIVSKSRIFYLKIILKSLISFKIMKQKENAINQLKNVRNSLQQSNQIKHVNKVKF